MNTLIAYLSKIDPQYLIAVASFVWLGGKWVVHKIEGDKQQSLKDTLWPTVEGVILKLAKDPFVVDVVRDKLTKAANEALSRAGVKPNAITDMVIAQLVDAGVTEVRKRVDAREAVEHLPAHLDAMIAAAQKVADSFKPPTNPTVPPLGLDIEIVKPAT